MGQVWGTGAELPAVDAAVGGGVLAWLRVTDGEDHHRCHCPRKTRPRTALLCGQGMEPPEVLPGCAPGLDRDHCSQAPC